MHFRRFGIFKKKINGKFKVPYFVHVTCDILTRSDWLKGLAFSRSASEELNKVWLKSQILKKCMFGIFKWHHWYVILIELLKTIDIIISYNCSLITHAWCIHVYLTIYLVYLHIIIYIIFINKYLKVESPFRAVDKLW